MLKSDIYKRILMFLFIILMILAINILLESKVNAQYRTDNLDTLNETQYPGYRALIDELKRLHPSWNFTLLYTELNWADVIVNETQGHFESPKSLIYYDKGGQWVCSICGTKTYDSGKWYCASEAAVAYQMDPRNSINDSDIFQFERLIYVPGAQTREGVWNMVSGTFMNNDTYVNAIMKAAETWGVSPYFLVSRMKQEQGSNGTELSNGTHGVYNHFNVGASGNSSSEITNNAINYARDHGWYTIEASIVGGTEFVLNQYINQGQDTLYFQKFDVDSSDGTLYSRQYMQNIQAPQTEGMTVRSNYLNNGKIDYGFTFVIPVYENMPAERCPRPASDKVVSVDALVKTNSTVCFRSGKGLSAGVITEIGNDTHVLIIERAMTTVDGYYWDRIMLDDGRIGYMCGDYVKEIPTITTFNEIVYTNNSVILRNAPRMNGSAIVSSLQAGQTVTRIDKGKYTFDGYTWDRIVLEDGRMGFVPTNYLTSQLQGNQVRVNANGGLAFRAERNMDSQIIEYVPEGTIVTRIEMATEKTGGYYLDKVRLPDGREGYMARGASDGSKVYLVPVDEPTTPVTPDPEPDPELEENRNYKIQDEQLICEPYTTLDDVRLEYSNATATDENLSTGTTINIDGNDYLVIKYGDLNCDGKVNTGDTLIMAKHILEKEFITDEVVKQAAEITGDGKINTGDSLALRKQVLRRENILIK